MKNTRSILFLIACALLAGPWIAFIACWILGFNDVGFDLAMAGAHAAGIIALLVWSIVYLKTSPRMARTGLVFATLFLIFWAVALLS